MRRKASFKKGIALVTAFALTATSAIGLNVTSSDAAAKKFVKSITVATSKIKVAEGAKKTRNVTVKVKGKASTKVSVKSSDTSVASVKVGKPSKKGVSKITITGNSEGTCKVTVTTKGKNKKKKSLSKKFAVTVTATNSGKNNGSSDAGTSGGNNNTAATNTPALDNSNAATPTVVPTVVPTEIPTEVPTAAPTSSPSATPTVEPTKDPTAVVQVDVTNIELSLSQTETIVGENVQASAVVSPDNATKKDVVYSTSDDTIAVVDETGKITALKEGSVDIIATATDESKVSATKKLHIAGKASIEFQKHNLAMVVGASSQLAVNVMPANAEIEYQTSNARVVSVDSTGRVTAESPGMATITASSSYKVKDECTIVVTTDDTIIISDFQGLSQNGTFTVAVSMQNNNNKVTDSLLLGTKLVLVNEETGAEIIASYVADSLVDGAATFAFDSTKIESGTYVLTSTGDSGYAIDSGTTDDLTETIAVRELTTGVAGYVYDTNSEPEAGVTVVCKASSDTLATTVTDINGYYEMKLSPNSRLKITASKENYFATTTSDFVVVTNNKVTSCNMTLDSIVKDELAIYGEVSISDKSNEKTISKNGLPKVSLQVENNGSYQTLETVYVSRDGYYAFVNSSRLIYTYSHGALNENRLFSYSNTRTLYGSSKLDKDKTYRVVVSKDVSADNLDAAYHEIPSKDFTLSETNKNTKVQDLTLVSVPEFKGLTIPAGGITWTTDAIAPTDTADIDISLYHNNELILNHETEIELNGSSSSNKEEITLAPVGNQTLTLPSGEYYVILRNGDNAAVYRTFTVSDTGKAVSLNDISFDASADFGFTIYLRSDRTEDKYVTIEELTEGAKVYELDMDGEVTSIQANVNASLYQVSRGKEIFISENKIENFYCRNNGGGLEVAATLPIKGLVRGNTYRIYLSSPVMSVYRQSPGEVEKIVKATDKKDGYYEFTYSSSLLSNKAFPELAPQSSVNAIKLSSSEQFKDSLLDAPFHVGTVKLLNNETGKEIKTIEVNRYYSCGNFEELSEDDQNLVSSEIYGGGDLIANGIRNIVDGDEIPLFNNVDAGKYNIQINIDGYQALTVENVTFVSLSEGSYTVDDEYQFIPIPDLNITGEIIDENHIAITDRVDITVLNSDNKVVAVGNTNSGSFTITNNNNDAVLSVNEAYTLVFRSASYGTKSISTEKLVDGTNNLESAVELKGGIGTVSATITDKNDNNISSGTTVYVMDNKYMDVLDENNFISEAIQKRYAALTYRGVYRMSRSVSNLSYWSRSNVPLGTYSVMVVGDDNYQETVKSAGTLSVDGSTLDAGAIKVNHAEGIVTTPVVIRLTKLNSKNNNDDYYSFDLMKIYAVDEKTGEETFVASDSYNLFGNSDLLKYSFATIDLPVGKYKAYVYSKNYYVEAKDFVVSTISTDKMTEDVTLSSSVATD